MPDRYLGKVQTVMSNGSRKDIQSSLQKGDFPGY